MFVVEMLVEAGRGINASRIARPHFIAKGRDGGPSAAIVVQERIKDVEGVFGRLAAGERAEFHRQKWPGFADADGEFLASPLKIQPSYEERAS